MVITELAIQISPFKALISSRFLEFRSSFLAFENCRLILLLSYTTHTSNDNVRTCLDPSLLLSLDSIVLDWCFDRGSIRCLRISAAYCSCYILLTPHNMKLYGPSTHYHYRQFVPNKGVLNTLSLAISLPFQWLTSPPLVNT